MSFPVDSSKVRVLDRTQRPRLQKGFTLQKEDIAMTRSLGISVRLLHEAAGHIVTVELKSGELYRGSMIECEDNWNCQLENITFTAKADGKVAGYRMTASVSSKVLVLEVLVKTFICILSFEFSVNRVLLLESQERERENAVGGAQLKPPHGIYMGITAFHRRRHHSHGRLIPAISAVSSAVLLLFSVFSFLAPSPTDHEHLRQHLVLNNVVVNAGGSAFRVPVRVLCFAILPVEEDWIVISGNENGPNSTMDAVMQAKHLRITDAVVAARILNATLVVPKLDQKSFWKDASSDARGILLGCKKSLNPRNSMSVEKLCKRKSAPLINQGCDYWNFPTWTFVYLVAVAYDCYLECTSVGSVEYDVLSTHGQAIERPLELSKVPLDTTEVLNRLTLAVQLTKFDYRLSNKLDKDLQKLRCRVNYHALKFTDPIIEMGERLVHRMRMRSKHYVALHLRFEPDMLAFSGCYYGGGDKERIELGAIRKRWKTLHGSNPDRGRRQGKCPLTPEEVGLMLRALGYGKDVHIYVASGEVYGGEETLAPLKVLFPNFYSKDTLAGKEELEPFAAFSSRMAALDFLVCDESDVFVTNNNGNMAKILAGRRRYNGHKPTIRPNAKKLYRLFLSRVNMTWEAFASGVRTYQRGFMGEPMELRPGRGAFHENPATCVCEDTKAKEKMELGPRKLGKDVESATRKDVSEVVDDQNDNDDEPEWSDPDDYDDQYAPLGKGLFNGMGSDEDNFLSEEPELEDMLSD
ncbi:hypothetical protein RHSIM_Rhsim01G0045100 [Rhododendron simsii]|uniref:O-fucosyltransferase family protein n=1 Tax=Rhododendron simsii TaxID=118357 RepID=A0A834HFN6_RHOSS|nr:hypothetical protein RHSIM_Rhsim01G0045100 [Rhododendron simsii]